MGSCQYSVQKSMQNIVQTPKNKNKNLNIDAYLTKYYQQEEVIWKLTL